MRIIILAAGKGTRMNLEIPKVLAPFGGRTMIDSLLEHALGSEVDANPIVVVGHQSALVRKTLEAYPVRVVEQSLQQGTGHAVRLCRDAVDPNEDIMVLYGDHPLVSSATIGALADEHDLGGAAITFMTYTVPDFDIYGGAFASFGRILRDSEGRVLGIREVKDASEAEKSIKEINPGYYVFSGAWLWQAIDKLEPKNAQKEYYLTDLLTLAIAEGKPVLSVPGDDLREAIGVNTMEQLALAETFLQP
jgi:bifunctional UDP-N-acetylglucosamine pyrophosphorylase/glucosamine-1-phosphate N-acetyltransferase